MEENKNSAQANITNCGSHILKIPSNNLTYWKLKKNHWEMSLRSVREVGLQYELEIQMIRCWKPGIYTTKVSFKTFQIACWWMSISY